MALLQVIDLEHERQPDLASGSLRGTAFIGQARYVLGLKAMNPPINRGA
jgi:hypothetical protein